MTIPIQPIGQFFENDKEGYVTNPASLNNISTTFLPLIDFIKSYYLETLGDDVHSIYLRGSLVRGTFVKSCSDIDSFALVYRPNIRWETLPLSSHLREMIANRFNFIGDVELMLSTFDESIYKSYPALAMIIKTQSLCIYGEDIADQIPRYQPGRDMMLHYKWLETDVDEFFRTCLTRSRGQEDKIKKEDCCAIMKLLIRVGFELVMERVKKYTADIYPAYESFVAYFPEREKDMKRCLHFYLNPKEDLDLQWLRSFSVWMVNKVKRQLYQF